MALEKQMELFDDGGLLQEGGSVDEESGNEVPTGSLKKEVRNLYYCETTCNHEQTRKSRHCFGIVWSTRQTQVDSTWSIRPRAPLWKEILHGYTF